MSESKASPVVKLMQKCRANAFVCVHTHYCSYLGIRAFYEKADTPNA